MGGGRGSSCVLEISYRNKKKIKRRLHKVLNFHRQDTAAIHCNRSRRKKPRSLRKKVATLSVLVVSQKRTDKELDDDRKRLHEVVNRIESYKGCIVHINICETPCTVMFCLYRGTCRWILSIGWEKRAVLYCSLDSLKSN